LNQYEQSQRDKACRNWLADHLPAYGSLRPLAGDASFRRYFRLHAEGTPYVLMDAPSLKETCQTFVAIAHAFQRLGLSVPTIHAADPDQGFLLLSDFGSQQLLDVLSDQTADDYYQRAFQDLLILQRCRHEQIIDYTLPSYDEALYRLEFDLFTNWYLERHLGASLSTTDHKRLDRVKNLLIESALSQPQVCVHRDYHSRNLMVLPDGRLGILDFQDAVWGPITYDLISLLRDCYITWPDEQVRAWIRAFHQRLVEAELLNQDDPADFLQCCDWMALQRHLKCLGIFARLHYRDNKGAYLQHIPSVLAYIRSVCHRYSEFSDLEMFL